MASSGARGGSQPEALVFGHPAGLFTLFFAEMWERFSYYGMRALLIFYMIKGFLGYGDDRAYAVYGAYTALVYATPFIGGMVADRLLGKRRAVVLGGLLMAAGHLLMTAESEPAFYAALGLLICGNGFFKPNISSIVGTLYPEGSTRRDAGFTIFYMGINLGGAMAPVLCGYVGETYGWHYGFGLATVGMLLGVAVFVAPTWLTQVLIVGGALATAIGMPFLGDTPLQLALRVLLGVALLAAAAVAFMALGRGGVPTSAGAPPDPAALARPVRIAGRSLGLRADWAVYLGALLSVPLFALLLQGSGSTMANGLGVFGALAFGYLIYNSAISPKVVRERMWVVLILTFFSLLFFAFFEQAGSSLNNFADRNVDRVVGERTVEASEVGQTLAGLQLNQGQVGYERDGQVLNLTELQQLRESGGAVADWTVTEANVGMGVGGDEIPASEFQATNPVFILIFGLVLTGLWAWLGVRGLEPSTPVKFSLGLVQLGLGFGVLWYAAANHADSRGVVGMSWLLLGYLLHTTGELCLSPVGLSMVTKLAPAQLVSTVMGSWFLATAASNFVAGQIARLTGIQSEGEGPQVIPPPLETLGLYGDVFGQIAVIAIGSGLFCLALSPILRRWMHEGEPAQAEESPRRTPATLRTERRARA
jgi:POT family proton-dependent oligopeptide transporter